MDAPEELSVTNKLLAEPLDVLLRGRPAACRPYAVLDHVGHPVRLRIDTAEERPARRPEERPARRPASRPCSLLYPWYEAKSPRDRSRRHRRVPNPERDCEVVPFSHVALSLVHDRRRRFLRRQFA